MQSKEQRFKSPCSLAHEVKQQQTVAFVCFFEARKMVLHSATAPVTRAHKNSWRASDVQEPGNTVLLLLLNRTGAFGIMRHVDTSKWAVALP